MSRKLLVGLLLLATAKVASAQDNVEITGDVVYGHKFGLALTFDVYKPKENPNGAGALFMVSGGWYSRWSPPEQRMSLFKPLIDKGFTVFAVRHGSSPKFSIPEAVEDVRRSVRFIRLHAKQFGIDPQRLGVFGASAGGHLSLMLGTASDKGNAESQDPVLRVSDRVQAVVAWVAPTDLRIMVWKAPNHLPAYDRYPALDLDLKRAKEVSPIVHVTPDDAPTLLVVGQKDELVPIKHSQDIHVAFESKKVISKLVVLPDAGHGFQGKDKDAAMQTLVDWFEKHLAE